MNSLSFEHMINERKPSAVNKGELLKLAILLAFGFAIRLILMSHPGYTYDLDYFFRPWAEYLIKTPLSDVYPMAGSNGIDIDYPPFYLYVMLLCGWVAQLFGIPLDYTAASTRFLFKYPAVLADLAVAILVWHIARRHFRSSAPLWAAAFFLFNPVMMYNSAVWGQVDSILVLFVILSLYLLVTNRFLIASVIFAVSITFKPQMLFMLPVFGTVLFLNARYWKFLLSIPLMIVSMVVVISPFAGTINPVSCLNFFTNILTRMEGKYKSLSMNMWNFWNSLANVMGGKAPPDTEKIVSDLPASVMSFVPTYHGLAIFLIAMLSLLVVILLIRRRNEGTVFLAAAIMFLGVSLLGTRMHERYPLPAVMLLGIVGLYYSGMRPLYFVLTFLHLINLHAILAWFLVSVKPNESYYFTPNKTLLDICTSPFTVHGVTILFYSSLFLMLLYLWIAVYGEKAQEDENKLGWIPDGFLPSLINDIKGSAVAIQTLLARPFFKRHYGWRGPFVVYRTDIAVNKNGRDWYEAIADWFSVVFSPKRRKQMLEQREKDSQPEPGTFTYFVRQFSSLLPDPAVINRIPPFKWFAMGFDPSIPIHRFTRVDAYFVLFFTVVAWLIYFYNYGSPEYLYFDEEYFAKTAYQFARLEHIYTNVGFPWETTHPHMGKLIQAAFIKMFGFSPDVYRVPNLIFGVLTIPFLYLLARDVLRSRRMAFFSAFFFMLCGLSFSQARLCTIDAPAVFFMVLAFFCFYKYFANLWPKLPALACTATAIGLAIATKWTSVFAMGMIIFLMFWRETAAVLAPVTSNSNIVRRFVCRWFSSRPFDLGGLDEFLLDPKDDSLNNKSAEIEQQASAETELQATAEAQVEGESVEQPINAQPVPSVVSEVLPLGGEGFVQPKIKFSTYITGIVMLVVFLIIVPLFIYAVSFVRIIQTSGGESKVTLYKQFYSTNLPGKFVWWYYSKRFDSSLDTVKVDTDTLEGVFALAIERSRDMFSYHANVGKEENYSQHPYESRWFHWPLLLKIIWYDTWSTSWPGYDQKIVRGTAAIGNPLLFWFGLPCILFLIWGAFEERRIGLLFTAIGFGFLYLPWVISPRQVTFFYHYLPAQPFLCMGIAYTLEDFWHDRFTRWLSVLFIIGVVAVFFYFYPWLNDLPLTEDGFRSRQWSGSWGVGY